MTINSTWALSNLFEYMATFSNAVEWDPWIVGAEALSDGGPTLHSGYRLYVEVAKRQMPLTYRIVEFDRLRRVVLVAENKVMRSVDAIEFNPAPGGTKLTYEATVVGMGPFAAADPIIGIALRKFGARAEEGLRARLEAMPVPTA